MHTCFLNNVIMNWKSTLLNRIVCLMWNTFTSQIYHRQRGCCSLFVKLVSHNSGSMGTKQGTGIPNQLHSSAIPIFSTTLHLRAGYSNTGENIQIPTKAGHTAYRVSLKEGLSYSNIFLAPEKDGGQRPPITSKP